MNTNQNDITNLNTISKHKAIDHYKAFLKTTYNGDLKTTVEEYDDEVLQKNKKLESNITERINAELFKYRGILLITAIFNVLLFCKDIKISSFLLLISRYSTSCLFNYCISIIFWKRQQVL